MKIVGTLLLILGVIVLINKGFNYTKTTQLIDAGPVQASVQSDRHVYLEPAIGVGAIILGALLLLQGRKTA